MINYSIEECKEYIERLNQDYKKMHIMSQDRDLLIGENNIEKRDVKGYHGREILELLQNADDAYQKSIEQGEKPSDDLCVRIKYIDNILTISNTGTFFDKEGVKAIVQGNNSDKKGKYIGSKGTGFRSILNWAKEIKVFSGNFKLRFSEYIAQSVFQEIKDFNQVKKQIAKQNDLYVPILACPEYINEERYNPQETTIEIYVDEDKIKDDYNVENQLNNIDSKILLFLPNITSISIETDDGFVEFRRVREDKSKKRNGKIIDVISSVKLHKLENGITTSTEEYDLFERIIKGTFLEDNNYKDVNLAIAVPSVLQDVDGHLYTFFPLLETKSPFNCVMHATYTLSDQRNTIIFDSNNNNKNIIVEQLKFIIDIVKDFYIKNKLYDKALDLLIPRNIGSFYNFSFSVGFANFKVEDKYIELLKDLEIFLTVNDKLISFNETPKLIEKDYPSCIKGQGFENLVQYSLTEKAVKLIKLICKTNYLSSDYRYIEDVLCDKISNISDNLTIDERVICYDWWEQNYKDCLPRLLKNQNDEWVEKGEECYFLTGDFDDIVTPNWIKVPALHSDYQDKLFEVVKGNLKYQEFKTKQQQNNQKPQHISRDICQGKVYELIKFTYRDKNGIIFTLNSSIENHAQAIEFVKWVWDYYRDYSEDWTPPNIQTYKYKFPTIDDKVLESSKVYFGREYDNEIAEELFDDGYQKLPSLQSFDIDNNQIIKFKKFMAKFGILTYPKISLGNISENSEYVKQIKQSMIDNSISVKSLTVEARTIRNFENIIDRLSTSQIIQWINEDNSLFVELLVATYKRGEFTISYKNRLDKINEYHRNDTIDNYLLYVLNNAKWITIDGNNYSPKEVVLDINSNTTILKIKNLVPVITIDFIKKIVNDINADIDKVFNILNLFKLCRKITDLSSDKFYGILLELPNLEKSIGRDVSRYIYRTIEESGFNTKYIWSKNKDLFWKEGKVLTQKQEFVLASEVYLPSTQILNKDQFHILDKGIRVGDSDKFVEVLNCKKYDKQTIVKKDLIERHVEDELFQKEFLKYKKYAEAYKSVNKGIEKVLKELSITLVSDITVTTDNVDAKVLDDYSVIRDTQTKWYITVFEPKYDKWKLSICIENIFSNIANTSGFDANKFGELFRVDKKGRDFLITKDFGSCDFIYEQDTSDFIKKKFVKALKRINQDFRLESHIDFSALDNIETIDAIISILAKEGIEDIQVLYNSGFDVRLDLKNYYQQKVDYIIGQNANEYKNYLFAQALNDTSLQSEFLNNWYKFKSYIIDFQIDNITDIMSKLYEKFGNWKISNYESADKMYEKNYQRLNPENHFAEDISNDDKIKQWIFFGEDDKFNKWLDSKRIENVDTKLKNDFVLNKYRDVLPVMQEISYSENVTSRAHSSGLHKDYVFVESKEKQKRERQKQIGDSGEFLIYNWLCDRYGEENVRPRSEAFVKLGKLFAGLEMSKDYDIEYTDPENEEIYFVEVKTGDRNSFNISPGELEFAQKHPKNHILFVVFDIDKEEPKFYKVPEEFWNNEKYHKKEIIETIDVTF